MTTKLYACAQIVLKTANLRLERATPTNRKRKENGYETLATAVSAIADPVYRQQWLEMMAREDACKENSEVHCRGVLSAGDAKRDILSAYSGSKTARGTKNSTKTARGTKNSMVATDRWMP